VLGRERRIETLRAVGLLLPIMEGLREAHDKGIVHRDLKPENLFLAKTARGRLQPKILDFGIAKLEQQVDSSTRLTQDGTVLGSPGYFSPEQARGETDIDFRTDVWSICVVLYELITGELPFTGPNYNALLMSILRDAPKPITNDGYGDQALWEILERGLQRDRDQRWSSMWELGRALAAWLHAKGVRADAASRSLEEVWLEARPSEQAPPPAGFAQQGTRRRVLSTLVKRRAADTLAGETISTVSVQRLMATRVLGWAAAAMGVGAIGWSLLTHSSSSPAPHGPTASAPVAASAPPENVRPPEPMSPASPARLSPPIASALPERAPAQQVKDALMGAKSAPAPTVEVHSKNVERMNASTASAKPTPVQRSVKLVEAPAPHHMSAPSASVVASRPKAAGRKSIDQEFGF
jgi:serine/threonine-protein kinase